MKPYTCRFLKDKPRRAFGPGFGEMASHCSSGSLPVDGAITPASGEVCWFIFLSMVRTVNEVKHRNRVEADPKNGLWMGSPRTKATPKESNQ